jgi:hypothetical protein
VRRAALIGAFPIAFLAAIDRLPTSLVNPGWTTNPGRAIGGAIGGSILGALLAIPAVIFWNTIVLPAWLLRQTTTPLAKVALGLGLILNGLILTLVSGSAKDVRLAPGTILKLPQLLSMVAGLITVVGPILCLEIAPRARSKAVLLWAVVLQLSALVCGANADRFGNEVEVVILSVSLPFSRALALLLVMASLPLFAVFLLRLACILERPDLEQRARFLLRLLAAAGIALAIPLIAGLGDWLVRWSNTDGGTLLLPIFAIPILIVPLLGIVGLFRSFGLIRATQSAIIERV